MITLPEFMVLQTASCAFAKTSTLGPSMNAAKSFPAVP